MVYFCVRFKVSHDIKKRLQISAQKGGTSAFSPFGRKTWESYFKHISRHKTWHGAVFVYVGPLRLTFNVFLLKSMTANQTQMISLFVESTVPSKRKKIKLSDWPTTSSVCCYYCCHTFTTVPIPFVHNEFEFDKLVFHISGDPSGVFCSVNCLIGYISHSNLDRVKLNHNAKMIELYWPRYFTLEEKECSLQPRPRYLLKMFGGHMTIDEFRRGSCRFVDKRPNPNIVQTKSGKVDNGEKDLMLWPALYPFLEDQTSPSTSATALATGSSGGTGLLTSMEDPSEAIGLMVGRTMSMNDEKTDNRTVTMVSEILQQTLDTKKLQEVSDALSGMTLAPTPATPPPPPRTAKDAKSSPQPNNKQNKTPKREPKRRKLKLNSPPTKYTSTQTSYSEHPLFARRTK